MGLADDLPSYPYCARSYPAKAKLARTTGIRARHLNNLKLPSYPVHLHALFAGPNDLLTCALQVRRYPLHLASHCDSPRGIGEASATLRRRARYFTLRIHNKHPRRIACRHTFTCFFPIRPPSRCLAFRTSATEVTVSLVRLVAPRQGSRPRGQALVNRIPRPCKMERRKLTGLPTLE